MHTFLNKCVEGSTSPENLGNKKMCVKVSQVGKKSLNQIKVG